MVLNLGTEYYRIHLPGGRPTQGYFRVIRTETELGLERFDHREKRWVDDPSMLDYYMGFEPGAEPIEASEAPEDGQAV